MHNQPVSTTGDVFTPSINPVSSKWLKGARCALRAYKLREADMRDIEHYMLEREFHDGKYQNFMLPIVQQLQNADTEFVEGFAALLGHVFATNAAGTPMDGRYLEQLLKTAKVKPSSVNGVRHD